MNSYPLPFANLLGSMSLPGRSNRARQHAPARSFANVKSMLDGAPDESIAASLSPSMIRALKIMSAGLKAQGIASGPAVVALHLAFGCDMSTEDAIAAISAGCKVVKATAGLSPLDILRSASNADRAEPDVEGDPTQ